MEPTNSPGTDARPLPVAGSGRGRSAAVLFAGNLLYQTSFAAIAILLPAVAVTFDASPAQLAEVVGAGAAGLAVTALPAGALAHRWGTRRPLAIGLALMGAGWTASAISGNLAELALFRFLTGAGGSLFYVSSFGWLGDSFSSARRGVVFGLFWSSGVAAGGTIGFVAGALLEPVVGWRPDLAIGGLATLGLAAMCAVVVRDAGGAGPTAPTGPTRSAVRSTLTSRSVWGLSVGVGGVATAATMTVAFLAVFVTRAHPSWGLDLAAIASSAGFIGTVPGGALGGWIGERGVDRRGPLATFAVAFGALLVAFPYASEVGFVALNAALGGLYGASVALLYAIPSHLPESGGPRLPLSIGLIETSQLIFAAAYALLFGEIVAGAGFTLAWLATAAVGLATVPALAFVRANRALAPPPPGRSSRGPID